MKNKRPEQMVIYQAKSGRIAFCGDLEQDTVWGNLQQIANLFDLQKPAISKHLKIITNQVNLIKSQLFPYWKQFKKKQTGKYHAKINAGDNPNEQH